MAGKIKSEIIRIDLTDASYKDSPAYIEPTYVNFFFGNNGAGKSTIAKAIKNGAGVTYAPGRTAADYLPLVYNQDFIDENFRSYRNMKGVFTLNAKNAEIQKQIDETTEERTRVKKLLTEATDKRRNTATAKDKLHRVFLKECWERGRTIREEFPGTMDKKGKSDPFVREILKHAPANIDIEKLRRLYESAYSETAKRYQRFNTIADPTVMDTVDGCDILGKSIVNSADTELAGFCVKSAQQNGCGRVTMRILTMLTEDVHIAAANCPQILSRPLLPALITDTRTICVFWANSWFDIKRLPMIYFFLCSQHQVNCTRRLILSRIATSWLSSRRLFRPTSKQ